MANPELSQRIRALPEELLGLEREPGTAECLRRIDALKGRARALEPLDGVEEMALSDYDRDWLVRYTYNSNAIEGSHRTRRPDTCSQREGSLTAWPTCANMLRRGGSWTRNWFGVSMR